jgi:hypothetical protein
MLGFGRNTRDSYEGRRQPPQASSVSVDDALGAGEAKSVSRAFHVNLAALPNFRLARQLSGIDGARLIAKNSAPRDD